MQLPPTRRRARRAVVFLIALVLGAGLVWGLAGAFASSGTPAPQAKVVLKVGWLAEPDNLNPFIGTLSSAFSVWYMNYDPLVGLSYADLTPTKGDKALGLAIGWTVSPDQKTWTFTLRKNARWQDGQPVTAADVAFTYNYIIDNDLSNFTSYTQSIAHVAAVDPYTVRFDCSSPKASMLSGWVPILPEHVWSKIPGSKAASQRVTLPMVGSGPFQCVQFQKGELVRMVANKDYWGGAPKIDEVDFLDYTNGDTMAAELKAGTLDACSGLLPAQVKSMQNIPGLTVKPIRVNGFDELGFNCYTGGPSLGNPVLKDPRFREALNYAVDKAKIDEIVYSGNATPGVTPITTGYYKNPDWAWKPPQPYTYDMTRAGQLLDAAGYRDTDGDGIRDYRGKPIALRLYARSESPNSQAAGKLLAGWFRKLGLKITLSTVDNGTLNDKLYNTVKGTFTPDYDMFLWGWYSDIDPGIIMSYFTKSQINAWSDCAWSDTQYDALYKQQATTLDVQKRKQLLDQMQQIWYQASPYIILAYSDDIEGWHTDKWGGWVQSPAGVGNVVFSPYGPGSFEYVYQKEATSLAASSSKAPLIVGLVLVVVVVAGILWFLLRRRRPQATEESI
jgi:peptide/nickel transport system substrate-binding protein